MSSIDDLLDVPLARLTHGLSRRDFVKLVGAGAALLGSGCAQRPSQRIVPYGSTPPELTPGNPEQYATAFVLDGFATGVLVTSNDGRPTKIEGNPDHPASLGATGAQEQASVLALYDGERPADIYEGRTARSVADFQAWLTESAPDRGEGLWILMEPTSSPTVARLIGRVRERFPAARFVFHGSGAGAAALEGARAAFGRPLVVRPDLTRADVIVALDGDPFSVGPARVRLAHDFAARRRAGLTGAGGAAPSRLYVAEPLLSCTGSVADRRLRARAADLPALARQILDALDGRPAESDFVAAAARDLAAARGRSAVLAGDTQPAATHALVHALNARLGNVGATIEYGDSPIFEAGGPSHDLAPLVAALDAGTVRMLLVLEGNPAYTAPGDLDLGRRIAKLPASAYVGAYVDETAQAARWFVPARHYLESWGDARAYDGTASLIQPLIAPLVANARSPAEILAMLAGEPGNQHDLVRATWTDRADSQAFWEGALQRGVVAGSALPAVTPAAPAAAPPAPPAPAAGLELVIALDPKLHDGRFAANPWLQELPEPMTKLTWGNAALVAPATAERLAVRTGDRVELGLGGRRLRAPVFVLPGVADDSVGLWLGHGHDVGPWVARGRGVDANALRTAGAPWGGPGLEIHRVGGADDLAFTQEHSVQEGRPIALLHTVEEARRDPEAIIEDQRGPLPSLLRDDYTPKAAMQWGMAIDLSLCTGCSACVVACQAENNIPCVGPEGVRRSREMHWLRIDRYFVGGSADPKVVSQPMLCQHCEKAPCEYVCPTNATVHSDDGLNEMVYNRCIGTRFCSNNCPYKVRRFNFLTYVDHTRTQLQKNPDVTVRQRGVMEKCTYCVQRIRRAEIQARNDRRTLGGNDVVTACQQACPTKAIVFGSITDPRADVTRLHDDPRAYEVLHELGTKPRTRYLVKLENP